MPHHYYLYHLAKVTYNNMRLLIINILFFLSIGLFSQNALRFNNIVTQDTIWIFENDKAKIQYKGYLNKTEEIKGKILQINDSIIIIGSRFLGTEKIKKRVVINDITGFRRFSVIRNITKTSLHIAVIAGGLYLPGILNVVSITGGYGIGVGTGFVGFAIINSIFSEKIKYTVNNGWQTKIMYKK